MEIRRAPTSALTEDELTQLRALLETTFAHDGGGFDEHDWAHALGGIHAIVEVDGRIVAHASVVPRVVAIDGLPLRTGYLEAVATHPDHERRGYGTRAVELCNEVIRAGYELGALSTGVRPFYARLGWERWEGPTWVDTPDGPKRTDEEDGAIMILRTPSTPPIDLAAPIRCDWREGDVW